MTYIPPAYIGAHVEYYRLELGTISLRWALLACIGGVMLGPQDFSDTNMLVFPMPNHCDSGLSQHEDPTRVVYRCSGI